MSKLTDKLISLGFTLEETVADGSIWRADGSDGRSNVSVYVDPSENTIQIVKSAHDPEEPTVVSTWSRVDFALLTVLELWT